MESLRYQAAYSTVKKLQNKGYIAYFAGGWVRDYLMKHPSDDIDIATSATVVEIQELFPKVIPVGIAFGVVIVVEESFHFEVSTFRVDHVYADGRRPTAIQRGSPEEDASRRDFTINGLFYDPITNAIYDFINGIQDIRGELIRTIGNPEIRFQEDRLRMIRGVRYATRFNFRIDPNTLEAIKKYAPTLFPSVSIERVWQEFKKMAAFPQFGTGIFLLYQLNLLSTIFPSLVNTDTEFMKIRAKIIDQLPESTPTIIKLLELFPEASLHEARELCNYLKTPKETLKFVEFYHPAKKLLLSPFQNQTTQTEWAHFYADSRSSLVIEIVASYSLKKDDFLNEHKKKWNKLKSFILRIKTNNPVVRAKDLISEGISPGKRLGILLKEAEKISIEEGIEDRSIILDILKKSSENWK